LVIVLNIGSVFSSQRHSYRAYNVNLRHTKEIEREAGGFSKYLTNQNNQYYSYNYGRPTENYRDKFEDAARADGRYLGIGLAIGVKGTGRGPFETATVRIGPSGTISVYTGAAAMGQGTHTMLAQVVAEQLGGDMENIVVVAGDTQPRSRSIPRPAGWCFATTRSCTIPAC